MEDLSLHILDIAEKSVAAGAKTIAIAVEEDIKNDILVMEIKDDGKGLDEETMKMVTDPFFTTKSVRKVGLGLPFLKQAADECEGRFSISSKEGQGTTITASFKLSHIDRKPLGDMGATVMVLIAGNPKIDFEFEYKKNGRHYSLNTREIKDELTGIPINSPEVLKIIRNNVDDGLKQLL